jgi:hypothetical protein
MKRMWHRLAARWRTPPLGVCGRCGAAVVVPVRWHEAGDDAWWMALRCGACGARQEVVVPDAEAERFGDALDAAVAEIAAAADRLDRERLGDQAAAFSAALARDLIDAGDFG